MSLVTTTRAVYQASQETTLKRDVDESMLKLEPDAAPLWVLTNQAKKRAAAIAPKFEWFEDAEAPLWGQVNNGVDYNNAATQINVVDGTIFAVDDLVIVPKAAGAGISAIEEIILVSAVNGNVLTMVRGIGGGATADVIPKNSSLRILGQACV